MSKVEPVMEGRIAGIRIKEQDPGEGPGKLVLTVETMATQEALEAYMTMRGQTIVMMALQYELGFSGGKEDS